MFSEYPIVVYVVGAAGDSDSNPNDNQNNNAAAGLDAGLGLSLEWDPILFDRLIVVHADPITVMTDNKKKISFNFNKLRSMLVRVRVGVQVDADQMVGPNCDKMFSATEQEVTADYPYPIMPVHWMTRYKRAPTPTPPPPPLPPGVSQPTLEASISSSPAAHPAPDVDRFAKFSIKYPGDAAGVDCSIRNGNGGDGGDTLCAASNISGSKAVGIGVPGFSPRIRWAHAHPTWTFHALAFIADALLCKLSTSEWQRTSRVQKAIMGSESTELPAPNPRQFMTEDEDMLNILLWRYRKHKQWCKLDPM